MVIDSTWIGVKEYIEDPLGSLEKYGFASSFRHVPEDEDMYDCLLPDEDNDDNFIYCQLSMTDVRDIVLEHPEIPVSVNDLEKPIMCHLLFMIDLYCDIYELIDFTEAEKVSKYSIEMSDQKIESLDDDKKLRMPNRPWKMTRKEAIKVLRYLKGRGYLPNMFTGEILRDAPETDIVECLDILSKYGCSKWKFIDSIKIDGGDLYFKRGKFHYKLND